MKTMARPAVAWRRPLLAAGLAIALVSLGRPAWSEPAIGIIGNPMDLSARVHEALLPGAVLIDDAHTVTGAGTSPKQTAEYLLTVPDMGQNFSGRSTNIPTAFASSLAESDGNGGVGVSAWSGGPAAHAGQDQVAQLVAQASWSQSFLYGSSSAADVSMHLVFPQIQLGLIGVPPQRSFASAAEMAEVRATLDSVITHADGSLAGGGSFVMYVRMNEVQIGTPGQYFNFADVQFEGIPEGTRLQFDTTNPSMPKFTVDPFSTNVKIGHLQPDDTVTYFYTLTAQGTTKGFERGFYAFIGDPFGLEPVTGSLVPGVAAVPEPSHGSLMLLGLAAVAAFVRSRRKY